MIYLLFLSCHFRRL